MMLGLCINASQVKSSQDAPYQPTVSAVYSARRSGNNNTNNQNDYRRTIIWNDGVILPENIRDLSPKQSPTRSIRAEESHEVLANGEYRRIITTPNSMSVTTDRHPTRCREMASNQNQNNQNADNNENGAPHTLTTKRGRRQARDDQFDLDDLYDNDDEGRDDEKTPRWMNRYIRDQNRNMNTFTNLLDDSSRRRDDDNESRLITRRREFDKHIEKLRIEHDLKAEFHYKLGKGKVADVDAQVRQIEWYEEVERFAERSELREIDQPLLIKIVAQGSLVNDV